MTTCLNCSYATEEVFAFCPKCGTKQAGDISSGDPLIGRTLNDKYRVLSELGKGSMGTVYLGEHISLKKKIALKVLHTDVQSGQEARQRFQREGIAAGQFTHPNAIQIFDFDMDEGPVFYLAMEYVEGLDLKRLILRDGALPVDAALDIMRQVLGALDEAHRNGIVHRDLKPENIMVVRSASGGMVQTVKVLDFGLSKLVDRPLDASLTEIGRVMGTPLYMSPEQVSGDAVDHRTDIYAAGLILYEMLSGKTPFSGTTLQEILGKHLKELPPSVVETKPDLKISEDLDAVLRKALEKDRAERFQSTEEMLAALQACQLDGPQAKATPRVKTGAPGGGRSKGALWIAIVAGFVGAVVVTLIMMLGRPGGSGAVLARVRSTPEAERTAAERNYLSLLDSARADLLTTDPTAALPKVQEALRAEVADAEGFFVRGLVYRERNDPDTARLDFEEALRMDPTFGDAAAQLGWMLLARGDRDGALESFLEAAGLDSACAEALAGQAAVRLQEGKLADAVRLTTQALTFDPDLVSANLYLGRARLAGDEPEQAVEAFVRAKRSAPGSWEALAGLGEAYLALERSDEAEQQFQGAIDLNPKAVAPRLSYAAMLVNREQFTDAVRELTDALDHLPDVGRLRVLLGIALAESGFVEGAVTELKKAVRSGSADGPARALLGMLLLGAGQAADALVELDAALATDETVASAHLHRGVALMQLGRYEDASEPLLRAVDLDPENAFVHLCLGALNMEFTGDTDAARDHLRRYQELGGEDERAARWLRQRVR